MLNQLKEIVFYVYGTDFSSFGRAFDCSSKTLSSKGSWFDSSKSEPILCVNGVVVTHNPSKVELRVRFPLDAKHKYITI